MAHETLKTLITNNIKTNGQNAITAQILQDVLIAMVDEYPDISGYATRTWVQQQGYATESWVNTQLDGYLPLTGGNISGDLTVQSIELAHSNEINSLQDGLNNLHLNYRVNGVVTICYGGGNCGIGTNNPNYKLDVNGSTNATTLYENGTLLSNKYLALTGGTMTGSMFFSSNGIQRGEIFGDEYGLNIQVSGYGKLFIENAIEADNTIKTEGFIKRGGTADQVLCADGSVKTLSELKAALNAI